MTVKFTLKRKEAPFLANVAMPFASILSKEYADKLQADGKMNQLNQMPLGTGPFTFVGYQQDAVIRYKANPDYWGDEAEDRRSGLRHHHRRRGPLPEAEGRRVPPDAVSERG